MILFFKYYISNDLFSCLFSYIYDYKQEIV